MAPVVITWNNSVAEYFTAARAAGESWVRLNNALTAWVAGIGEPDTITVLETFAQTVDWTNFSWCQLGVHKDIASGVFNYGLGIYKFQGDFPLLQLEPGYNYASGTLLNGHRRGSTATLPISLISRSVANNNSVMTIVYNTSPGDQYFHFIDKSADTSFTIVRLVRPSASTYPSTAQAAEFGLISTDGNLRTFANGPIAVNVPWSATTRNIPIRPNDTGYIFAGYPVFSQSLYLGNLPPGVGVASSATPLGIITTVGSESWITGSSNISVRRSI